MTPASSALDRPEQPAASPVPKFINIKLNLEALCGCRGDDEERGEGGANDADEAHDAEVAEGGNHGEAEGQDASPY